MTNVSSFRNDLDCDIVRYFYVDGYVSEIQSQYSLFNIKSFAFYTDEQGVVMITFVVLYDL